jgi:hypothetical protein
MSKSFLFSHLFRLEFNLSDDDRNIVNFSASEVVVMLTGALGERADPVLVVGVFFGLLGDQFGAEGGVFEADLVADEGAHEVDNLGIEKVIEQTI